MGLDMYLYADRFISQHSNGDAFNELVDALDAQAYAKTHVIVDIEVGYWRKANAIHNWFVGDEEDNCQPIYISREQLETLLMLCKQVKDDNSLANELLPPVSGFFFGSDQVDDWYWENIDSTITILEDALADKNIESFKYQASW